MTKIEIERRDDGYHLVAKNEDGASLSMDASRDIGGKNMGLRPMQVLLSSLGGCSGIDVISLLKKQRQELRDIKITLTGERESGKIPSLYTSIHVHYKLFGTIDNDKAEKAVNLSMEKYCSVARTLEKTARITYSFEIIK